MPLEDLINDIREDVEGGEHLQVYVDDRLRKELTVVVYYTSSVGWYILIKGKRFAIDNVGKYFRLRLRTGVNYND